MNASTPPDDIEARARRRVGMKMGFYIHLLVYVLVNLGLFAINMARGGEHWAIWPLAGWGLGLAIHGIVTFLNLSGEGMRERMLKDEIERLRRKG
ncbi:MAG: 2TM domain-containing protein [Burkholderiaceae bacterium]|nr:2TM domain-containing protein [Burkholderiaceae bacterium]